MGASGWASARIPEMVAISEHWMLMASISARFPNEQREVIARNIAAQLYDLELPLVPIFSKSGALHLYFFSSSRVAADKLQRFMSHYSDQLDLGELRDAARTN